MEFAFEGNSSGAQGTSPQPSSTADDADNQSKDADRSSKIRRFPHSSKPFFSALTTDSRYEGCSWFRVGPPRWVPITPRQNWRRRPTIQELGGVTRTSFCDGASPTTSIAEQFFSRLAVPIRVGSYLSRPGSTGVPAPGAQPGAEGGVGQGSWSGLRVSKGNGIPSAAAYPSFG